MVVKKRSRRPIKKLGAHKMSLPDSHVLSEKSAELESTKEAYHVAIGRLHVYMILNNIENGHLDEQLDRLMDERSHLRNFDVDTLKNKRLTVLGIVDDLIKNHN